MAEDTGTIPKAIQDRPKLNGIETEAWNAFARLSSRRPVSGFGSVGGIPYTEMLSYLDGILCIDDPEDRGYIIELIEFLDSEFLKQVAEKQKADKAKSSKSVATPPSPKPPIPR